MIEICLTVTRLLSLEEEELLTLPEHLGSHTVLTGVRVARSLVLLCRLLYVHSSFIF